MHDLPIRAKDIDHQIVTQRLDEIGGALQSSKNGGSYSKVWIRASARRGAPPQMELKRGSGSKVATWRLREKRGVLFQELFLVFGKLVGHEDRI